MTIKPTKSANGERASERAPEAESGSGRSGPAFVETRLAELKKETAPASESYKERERMREQLNFRIDDGSAKKLERLSFEKIHSPEQAETMKLLETALLPLAINVFHAGLTNPQARAIATGAVPPELKGKLGNPGLVIALDKFIESQRTTALPEYKKRLAEAWQHAVEIGETGYQAAQFATGTQPSTQPPQDAKEKSAWEKTKQLGKDAAEFLGKHKTGVALTLGGVGALWLVHKWFSKKNNSAESGGKDEESSWWKYTKRTLLVAATIMGIGSILHIEGVKKMLRDWHIDVDDNRLLKAMTYLSVQDFSPKKFWETLMDGNVEYVAHKAIAEAISKDIEKDVNKKNAVTPQTVQALSKEPFSKFDAFGKKEISWLFSKAAEHAPGSLTAGLGIFNKSPIELAQEEKYIRDYIGKHRDKLKNFPVTDATTVIEVLAYLTGQQGVLEKAQEKANPEGVKQLKEVDGIIATLPEGRKKQALQKERTLAMHIIPHEEINARVAMMQKHKLDPNKLIAADQKLRLTLETLKTASKNPQATDEQVEQAAQLFHKASEEFDAINAELEKECNYRPGMDELKYLIATQGAMTARRLILTPAYYRSFAFSTVKNVVAHPFVAASEKIMSMAGMDIDHALKVATQEITSMKTFLASKGFSADEIDALEKSAKGSTLTAAEEAHFTSAKTKMNTMNDPAVTRNASLFEAHVASKHLNEAKRELRKVDNQIAELRKSKAPNAEKQIAGLEAERKVRLEQLHEKEIQFAGKRVTVIDKQAEIYAEKIKGGTFSEHDWDYFKKLETEIESHRALIMDEITETTDKLRRLAKGEAIGENAVALEKRINQLWEAYSADKKLLASTTDKFGTELVRWYKKPFKLIEGKWIKLSPQEASKVYDDGLTKLRGHLHKLMGDAKKEAAMEAKHSGMLKTGVRNLGMGKMGKIGIYTLVISGGGMLGSDEKTGFATAAGQTALDIAPITGELSDFYSAITGKEFITKRDLDVVDRFIRLGFGIGGTIADLGSWGTVGTWLRSVGSGLRGARTLARGEKALKLVHGGEALARGAEHAAERGIVGGAERAAESGAARATERTAETATERAAEDVIKDAEKRGIRITRDQLKTMGKRITYASMAGALASMGYNIAFKKEEVPLSAETQQAIQDMETRLPPEVTAEPVANAAAPADAAIETPKAA